MENTQKIVPIPIKENAWKSKLDGLQIGESFSFDKDKRSNVAYAISAHFHALSDKVFTISADPLDDNKLRAWRTK